MPINDLHIHLYPAADMTRETSAAARPLAPVFDGLAERLAGGGVTGALAIILDTDALRRPAALEFFAAKKSQGNHANIRLACNLDFRADDAPELLEKAAELGFCCLKFLPYEQAIATEDYDSVARLAARADELELFIMVCCAFGTRHLYDYSGIKLAAALSERVKCPVVMAHGGGARVLDALCAALDAPNLYFDLSFSLPFYAESRLAEDFAFAIRKLGPERWAFGSDAPFMDLEESVKITTDFLDRFGFTDDDIRHIMFDTANRLLQRQW